MGVFFEIRARTSTLAHPSTLMPPHKRTVVCTWRNFPTTWSMCSRIGCPPSSISESILSFSSVSSFARCRSRTYRHGRTMRHVSREQLFFYTHTHTLSCKHAVTHILTLAICGIIRLSVMPSIFIHGTARPVNRYTKTRNISWES